MRRRAAHALRYTTTRLVNPAIKSTPRSTTTTVRFASSLDQLVFHRNCHAYTDQASPRMSTSTSEEEELILRAAGLYDEMKVDSSTIVARVSGGEWERVEAVKTYYTDRLCKVTKNTYGPSFCFSSTAGVLRVSRDAGGESAQKQVEAQFFTASAGAEYSKLYKGGNAKLTLAGGNVSAVNYHVGAGLSTGAGIKDEAVQVKLAGCGFSVGRKMGVSVFDNEVGVDFGKCKTQ